MGKGAELDHANPRNFKFSPFWPFIYTKQVFSITKKCAFQKRSHKCIHLNTAISQCSADMKIGSLENWYIIVSRGLALQLANNSVNADDTGITIQCSDVTLYQCLSENIKYGGGEIYFSLGRKCAKTVSVWICGITEVWTGFWFCLSTTPQMEFWTTTAALQRLGASVKCCCNG